MKNKALVGILLFSAMGYGRLLFAEVSTAYTNKDTACGPRCVKFILDIYGRQESLITLVKEVQWPALEDGSSLEDLSVSLNRRALHTRAIHTNMQTLLAFESPLIIHVVARDNAVGKKRDHFMVLLPESSSARYWDWLRGYSQDLPNEYRASGNALIVSDHEIPLHAVTSVGWSFSSVMTTVVFVLLVFGSFCTLLNLWLRRCAYAINRSVVL